MAEALDLTMRKNDSEELQHICMYEKDTDNESFHSLEAESNVDEIIQEKVEPKERIIPSNETTFGILHEEYQEKNMNESSLSFSDYLSDNQCIDACSASDADVKQFVSNLDDISVPNVNCSMTRHENSSESVSCFSESDICFDKTIYRRHRQDNQSSQEAQNSRVGKENSFARSISCTDECPLHSEEIIKYLCKPCNKLACQACCTIDHKHCDTAEYIPTFIGKPEFHFEERCKEFEENLHQIEDSLNLNKQKARSNLRACEQMKINAKAQFKKQRDELNKMCDCMEQDFNRKISEIEHSGKESVRAVVKRQEKIENELQEHKQDYNQRKNEGNISRIFTKIEMSKSIIEDLRADLERIENNNKVERYVFMPSKGVLDFKRNVEELGNIETIHSESKSKITDIKTIDMKTETDNGACKISGLILLSKRHLLAVDYANAALKVVDIFNVTDVISVPVRPAPFDGSVITDTQRCIHDTDPVNGQIVLTLPENNILRFIDYTLPSTFTAIKDVQTNGMCRAVCYNNGKLFVTFPKKGKIEILDIDGKLLNRITTDTIGGLFQPMAITMDVNVGKLFVSDRDNHAVYCMNTDGGVIAKFHDHDLIQPRGMCVNMTGAIFVCSLANHKIHHLSADCRQISTMNVCDEESPAPYPYSVAFSDENNAIYVGQFTKNCIKVFSLEEAFVT